jgi:hypothetical protein
MIILALDPAEYRIGWALGESGTLPKVGLYKLRAKDERTEEAVERFANWLMELIMREQVGLVTVEQFLPSGALKGRTTDATREGAIGLNYAARAVTAICGRPFRSIAPATIRVHFIGKASMGGRDETKRAVIKQAQLLGYLAKDCMDPDMADAAALWDFSTSHFARRASAFQLG